MKSVLISIIVPVYNVEPYLAECLDSILSQTFCDYEIICVEDASSDSSYQILKEYAEKDKRICILKNEKNQGLSYSRNRGIEAAVGKYIIFVDSDDMLKVDALNQLWKKAEECDFPEILYYDAEVRNEGVWANEQPEKSKAHFLFESSIGDGKEFYVQLNKHSELIVEAWRQMIRKDFLMNNAISFYNGIYHEDVLFSFKCAMKAVQVSYFQKELYIYRRRDNSIISTMNLRRVQSLFIVFIELWNYWKNGIWSEEVNELFGNFLDDLYKQFINKVSYYPNEGLTELGNIADQFMYRLIADNRLQTYEYITQSELLIREARKSPHVMVYGAGNVGIEVVRLLHSSNIAIDKVLVSDKKSNPEKLMGVPIVEFNDCEVEEETMIIIAVLKSNERAITDITENIRKNTQAGMIMYDGTRVF